MTMADRTTRLRDAFAAYNDGDLGPVAELFAAEAAWHGVEGMGFAGETPV